jgi:hypothetical protein
MKSAYDTRVIDERAAEALLKHVADAVRAEAEPWQAEMRRLKRHRQSARRYAALYRCSTVIGVIEQLADRIQWGALLRKASAVKLRRSRRVTVIDDAVGWGGDD